MKLSKKQKEVIQILREGTFIHWIGGLNPRAIIHAKIYYRLPVTTVFKLEDLKLIEFNEYRDKASLTELGKTIDL